MLKLVSARSSSFQSGDVALVFAFADRLRFLTCPLSFLPLLDFCSAFFG